MYSSSAMKHLKSIGAIVYLYLPIENIEKRITNLDVRGVVMPKDRTLGQLYKERKPLYEKFAQITIDCTNKTHEEIVNEIITAIG